VHIVQNTTVRIICTAHHRLQDTVKIACEESDPSTAAGGLLSHKQRSKDTKHNA